MVRKIPPELENPIDNIFYDIADKTDTPYRKLNMTANHITTLSLIFGLLSAQQLYIGNNGLATLFFIIAFYYDCMDGNYARKYKMTSEFGELYDHISDLFKYALLFFIMYKLNPKKALIIIPIILFFSVLMSVHLGCQEKIYDKDNNKDQHLLPVTQMLCPNPKYIYITKYFGVGTVITITSLFIYTF